MRIVIIYIALCITMQCRGQHNLLNQEFARAYFPNYLELDLKDSINSFDIDSNEIFSELDLTGYKLSEIEDSEHKYAGLGSVKQVFTDSLYRASFAFEFFDFHLKGSELLIIQMKNDAPFTDFHYQDVAIFVKSDSGFRHVFSSHGNILGYYPDSSFLVYNAPCCISGYNIFYMMKQTGNRNSLDTLRSITIYGSRAYATTPFIPPSSLISESSVKLKKGVKFYSFPDTSGSPITCPIVIGEANKRLINISMLDECLISGQQWKSVLIQKEDIKFIENRLGDRIVPFTDQVVWIMN